MVVKSVLMPFWQQLWIGPYLHLLADVNRPEILRQPFIKPALRGRVVEIQKVMRQRMRHRAPRIGLEKIEHDINPIRAWHIKSGRLALFRWSHRAILLVAL